MTAAILILIGICGAAFYLMRKRPAAERKKKAGGARASSPPYGENALRIENVGPGGMIHLSGIGSEMEEFDVTILAKHLYREGNAEWYELEGESPSGKVWIDLEEDDTLELAITLKKLKLRDVGLTKGRLREIDDEEEGEIVYQGETYVYEDSDEATFYRYGDRSNGERFYYWDFENNAGDRFIGVERWADGAYEVSYSEAIQPHQVTVYSLHK